MSDGSRSRTGCLTCRIRKKKCDERRPVCQACMSRQLTCYGFSEPPPTWYTSSANWREVRNSSEVKDLRTLAETRYKIRRKIGSKGSGVQEDIDLQDHVDEQRHWPTQLAPGTLSTTFGMPTPRFPTSKTANVWQLQPESLWWDSKIRSLAVAPTSSSHEETRLLMLFLDVIHPIAHSFYRLDSKSVRRWMLSRLVSNQALYLSSLSVSACFDFSLHQPPTINEIGIYPKVRILQNNAVRELRAEVDRFALMSTEPVEDLLWAGIGIIEVIVHLECLEIFSMLQGCWELHHRASRKVMDHLEMRISAVIQVERDKYCSVVDAALSTWSLDDEQKRRLEFALANYVWVDVLAISTFGIETYAPSTFDYRGLLKSKMVKPESVMGCQGWIMAVIVDIARLEQWKKMHHAQINEPRTKAEFVQRGNRLARALASGTRALESPPKESHQAALDDDIRLVSVVWAYGARVLLQFALDGTETEMDQTFIDACLQSIERLPKRLFLRISFPYTIAGCMSISEARHSRFRQVLQRTMQDAQPPGISWKGLIVMEECWRLRSSGFARAGWRDSMGSLGARVILT